MTSRGRSDRRTCTGTSAGRSNSGSSGTHDSTPGVDIVGSQEREGPKSVPSSADTVPPLEGPHLDWRPDLPKEGE